MTSPSDEALCKELDNAASCVPGCEGRCRVCPADVASKVKIRLAELAAEVATERLAYAGASSRAEQAKSLAAATFERTKQRAAEVCDERMRLMTDARGEVREHVIADRFLARAGEAMQCATAIRNLPPEEPRNGEAGKS